jgi:apolipoprotein D and lipocalin family protein
MIEKFKFNRGMNMVGRNLSSSFIISAAIVVLGAISFISIASDSSTLQVVPSVNLSQYTGLWYELARLPNSFQDKEGNKCDFVTAEYTLRNDGNIGVVNSCRLENGETKTVKGVGRVADEQTNSRLEINFGPEFFGYLPFLWGDYNIIELAPNYSYALVGSSDRKGLWILSCKPNLEEATFTQLLEKAAKQSSNVSIVKKTKQIE